MTSTITIYGSDSAILHSDTYPSEWSFKALQKLARNWMRFVSGVRYQIDTPGETYYSKKVVARAQAASWRVS